MALFKNTFRIESTRLKGYDYSQPGEYFVTICTHNRECIFGMIVEEEIKLSHIGMIAKNCWENIPDYFHNVELDEFVVMPNHIHGIIIICENNIRRDTINRVSTGGITKTNNPNGRDVQLNVSTRISPKRGTLSVVIRTFKAAVTTQC